MPSSSPGRPSTRIGFVDRLARALARGATTRVVLTLRSESLGGMLASTVLEGRPVTTMPLGRLAPERLAEAIEKPARRAGLELEPGLVARMVEETTAGSASGGDALPLLAFSGAGGSRPRGARRRWRRLARARRPRSS